MIEEKLPSLRELCLEYTDLALEDISQLETMAGQISFVSELTETDIFIDALTSNGIDAIVLAWAPPRQNSLYRHSVVGELAYATREPAVYQVFSAGEMVRNVRGVSQEGVPIAQTVVPLHNNVRQIIGVLIMEKDITAEVRQAEQVEFLSQTAERLSSTLMSFSMTNSTWEDWLGNGIFVLNLKGEITYANRNAARMYRKARGCEPLSSDLMAVLGYQSVQDLLEGMKNPMEFNFGQEAFLFQAHPLVTYGELSGCVISLQDVTELRRKEKQLNIQSTIIREIHHRVKNNLQNVVSLLRLQMHRSESAVVQSEFSACINRVFSITQVHDMFARQNWDSIDLLDLAEGILTKLVESSTLPEQQIKTAVQGQSVRIPATQAVPMALVINELVTNSLKHGIGQEPYGEISILVEESAGTVHIMVADSGSSLVLTKPQGKAGHLGLYIVNLLICDQLEGGFQLERQGGSTVAKVSFSLSNAEEYG
jgi:two-component sensor histidine kinase